jgi:adenylylsulfate reductase subunit A
MQTADAIKAIADKAPDEKAAKRKLKELEAEAWEDFLDMTISQAILWAASNVEPEKKPSEIMACDPYFIGSHSGASGAWVSGPEDLQSAGTRDEYFWGYQHMTTVNGMFAAGDASGASSHKFSSGSHAEGRIAAKAAVSYIVDHPDAPKVDQAQVDALSEEIWKPLAIFEEHKGATTDPDINPNYIRPKQFMYRLQKIMVFRVSSRPATNSSRRAWSC